MLQLTSLAVAVVIASSPLVAAEPERVDLCSLVADPVKWDGRMIAVRGPIYAPRLDGFLELSTAQCPTKISAKGHEFDPFILLADGRIYPSRFKVDFVFPHDDSVLRSYLHSVSGERAGRLYGTVEGLFETRVPLDDLIKETARNPYNGFGDGTGPAQLLVKSITELVLSPK